MTSALPLLGLLLCLGLLVIIWRKRPFLGVGIFLGVAVASMVMAVVPALEGGDVPIWLPALPFAVVAVTLFGFGILAWLWGDKS